MVDGAVPPVTEGLVRRLEQAIDAYAVAWLEGRIASAHPAETVLRRFGEAVAAATPSEPELDFVNRIHGLAWIDAARLGEVLDFYRGLGLRPWIELPPGAEELAARLADAGARPVASLAVVYGVPSPRSAAAVEVLELGASEGLRFGALLLEGLGVPAPAVATDAPAAAAWATTAGVRIYVARVDGDDAGAAALSIGDGVGYLANAATLPRFRRRGCQTALISRRIADAAGAGCDLVASLATFASVSQRNLERAGLRTAYTRTVWRLR